MWPTAVACLRGTPPRGPGRVSVAPEYAINMMTAWRYSGRTWTRRRRLIAMKPREMTILSIALGVWMAWRLVGSTLIPVGSQEIGIAIIVLFKPWLDFRGWMFLLAINATSHLYSWYRAWIYIMPPYLQMVQWMVEIDMIGMRFMSMAPPIGWAIGSCLAISFIYTFFIWPYIWERVYRKAGLWGKLNG